MYEGLTPEDKKALEDAKARGYNHTVVRDLIFVNIDLALAQIAEMEEERNPMTVNEWLNQATPEQKAVWSLNEWTQMHNEAANYAREDPNDFPNRYFERMTELFNRPYTEGEAK